MVLGLAEKDNAHLAAGAWTDLPILHYAGGGSETLFTVQRQVCRNAAVMNRLEGGVRLRPRGRAGGTFGESMADNDLEAQA